MKTLLAGLTIAVISVCGLHARTLLNQSDWTVTETNAAAIWTDGNLSFQKTAPDEVTDYSVVATWNSPLSFDHDWNLVVGVSVPRLDNGELPFGHMPWLQLHVEGQSPERWLGWLGWLGAGVITVPQPEQPSVLGTVACQWAGPAAWTSPSLMIYMSDFAWWRAHPDLDGWTQSWWTPVAYGGPGGQLHVLYAISYNNSTHEIQAFVALPQAGPGWRQIASANVTDWSVFDLRPGESYTTGFQLFFDSATWRTRAPVGGEIAFTSFDYDPQTAGNFASTTFTWKSDAPTNDWNNNDNWIPARFPTDGNSDVAVFGASSQTAISLFGHASVAGIVFRPDASSYTITMDPGPTGSRISIRGTGITNFSAEVQKFISAVNDSSDHGGSFAFEGSATAGIHTQFINKGGIPNEHWDSNWGTVQFYDTSSADHGAYINEGGAAAGLRGGFVQFFNNTTAEHGTFTNKGGAVAGAYGGVLQFMGAGSAASSTIVNEGGAVTGSSGSTFVSDSGATVGSGGGNLGFMDNSTADSASITNSVGAATNTEGGYTSFMGTASAGHAVLTNKGGTISGGGPGWTRFHDSATAAGGTFLNEGGTVANADGGYTYFYDPGATAGDGTFLNEGGTAGGARGGYTEFHGGASAANSTLIAKSGRNGGLGGSIVFGNGSTGGTAKVRLYGNGNLDIRGRNAPGITVGTIEGDGMIYTGLNRLSASTLTWTGGGILNIDLAQDGASGQLALTGALTKAGAGTYTIALQPSGPLTPGYSYTVATFASTNCVPDDFVVTGLSDGYGGQVLLTDSSLHVVIVTRPVITSATSATGVFGSPFNYVIMANNSPESYSATGLPPGLAINSATGVISGTPAVAGRFQVALGATNSAGIGTAPLALTIAPAPAIISLSSGGGQPVRLVYDGMPKTPDIATDPADLAVTFTYNGSTTPPTLPGTYHVVVTINDPNYTGTTEGTLVISITALVRHAPTLNGGLDGSLQVQSPESVTLNGNAWVSGDLLIPGMPTVRLNGHPTYDGTIDGTGQATPTDHTVTLNGNAAMQHVVRCTDAIPMPVVIAPPAPMGTRNVALNSSSQNPGDFATLRDLTLNSNAGAVTVPAGTYGTFLANGNSSFVFGVAGAVATSVYNLQGLALNGNSRLTIRGPVILNLARGTVVNGSAGAADHPEWLQLNVVSGGLTLNGNASFDGYVTAPSGTIVINGKCLLQGEVVCDQLTINGNGGLFEPEE